MDLTTYLSSAKMNLILFSGTSFVLYLVNRCGEIFRDSL
jgi:hypothetical protein